MIEAFRFHRKMVHLLHAPCIHCGYENHEDYWHDKTHDSDCPFHRIAGFSRRKEALPYLVRRWAAICFNYKKIRTEREIIK